MDLDIPPEAVKLAPGAVGSAVSLAFIKGTWPQKLTMFAAGAALARFGTENASAWSGLNGGFTGFLLGLFGMAIVSKLFETWQRFDLGGLLGEWARKVLGLPPKAPEVDQPQPPKEG